MTVAKNFAYTRKNISSISIEMERAKGEITDDIFPDIPELPSRNYKTFVLSLGNLKLGELLSVAPNRNLKALKLRPRNFQTMANSPIGIWINRPNMHVCR